MIDVLGESLRAVGTRSALAYPLVLGAGVLTGIGPCAAPRYVAVAALTHAARTPRTTLAAFTAGLVGAYVALGALAGTAGTAAWGVASLWSASPVVYALLATALLAGGVVTLIRARGDVATAVCAQRGAATSLHAERDVTSTHVGRASHAGPCAHDHAHTQARLHADARARDHAHAVDGRGSTTLGGAFLLGASSVLVVSPCCTPVVAAIAALTLATGRALDGVSLLAVFALGHVVPVALAGALGNRFAGVLRRVTASQAPAIVSGALMLALGAYYGVLA